MAILIKMAGVGGLEPPHGGIKTRCLTTWLHPNKLLMSANDLLTSKTYSSKHFL